MSKPFFVSDCMHENPVKVRSDANIQDAIQLIIDNHISGLTVVDENDQVIGVISELDCLEKIIGNAYNQGSPGAVSVGEFMTREVDTCAPTDDIVEVAEAMLAKGQRRRPVVKNGKLVGQVSCRNILWAVSGYLAR